MAHAEKRGKFYRVRYKKPDGHWGSASRDDFGNRFRTAREAETYGHALETDGRRGTFLNPRSGRITVREWAQEWLESIDVRQISERDYRSRLRVAILPYWGDVPIGDITAVGVATWEKQLRAERAPNSVSGIIGVFRTLLDDAVEAKLRADNPVPTQRRRRRGRYAPQPAPEPMIASPRQVLLLARSALELRGLNLYALIVTAAYTGLRLGEVAGLTRDVLVLEDLGSGPRILLEHQTQYVDGKPALVPCKYGSDRGLILPPFLAVMLSSLLASRTDDLEFVFRAPKGGRIIVSGQWYEDNWHPLVYGRPAKASTRGHAAQQMIRPVAGLAGLTPHGLRHSMKVWLDQAGHPSVAVEARMGHKLPGVQGTYSHVTLEMEQAIAATLQHLWEESQDCTDLDVEWGLEPLERPRRRRIAATVRPPKAPTVSQSS